MKKSFTVVARTKSEWASNSLPSTVPPQSYPTWPGAKTNYLALISGGTVSYLEIYGPSGLLAKRFNPAGA
jgi:hypothetical protein